MNKYEILKDHMNMALKTGDKLRRLTLADIIATIDKAATSGKTRIEITDAFVDEILIKYQKTVQEMIDTCPNTEQYAKYKETYQLRFDIVKGYAPQLIVDEGRIKAMVLDALNGEIELVKKNRGQIMKIVMPILKGRVDMGIANKVISEMLV